LNYRLLASFRALFEGNQYLHRRSTLGDSVAREFYEDLYNLGRSPSLNERIDRSVAVLNAQNRRVGIPARRGDGTFGELVPGAAAKKDEDHRVALGPISNVQIGVEVKILFKAMIK
jgi:hypothetical protein